MRADGLLVEIERLADEAASTRAQLETLVRALLALEQKLSARSTERGPEGDARPADPDAADPPGQPRRAHDRSRFSDDTD